MKATVQGNPSVTSLLPLDNAWGWGVGGLTLLCMLVSLGLYPLVDLDEGAFSAATFEMIKRGEYLFTYLAGEPRYDKPILYYWFAAASVSLFGSEAWAYRLPSLLAGLGWAYAAYRYASAVWGNRTGLLAGWVSLTAVGPQFMFHAATADALLDLWIACSCFCWMYWLRTGSTRFLNLACVIMGLGFVTKGPVAVLFPSAAAAITLLLTGQKERLWKLMTHWQGLMLFLVVAAPWYIAVSIVYGPGFVLNFFGVHNLGRFTGAMGSPHSQIPLYYLFVLVLLMLPYTSVFAQAFRKIKASRKSPEFVFSMVLFGLVFILFSFSANQLPQYLIYGLPGMLIMTALQMQESRSRWHAMPAMVLIALLFFAPLILQVAADQTDNYYSLLIRDNLMVGLIGYYLLLAAGFGIQLWMFLSRRIPVWAMMAGNGAVVTIALSLIVLPGVGGLLQSGVAELGQKAREWPTARLVMHEINMPSLTVAADRVVSRGPVQPGDLVFTRERELDRLPAHTVIQRAGHLVLIKIDSPEVLQAR